MPHLGLLVDRGGVDELETKKALLWSPSLPTVEERYALAEAGKGGNTEASNSIKMVSNYTWNFNFGLLASSNQLINMG
jgi:hypothetical protein